MLLNAVRDGVARLDAPFAYATGLSAEGYHTGLLFRQHGPVYFDARSLLIHPDHMLTPPSSEPPPVVEAKEGGGIAVPASQPGPKLPTPPSEKKITRYYGRIKLDPQRVNKQVSDVVAEVLEHFTSLVGCQVEVTLEIQANYVAGFSESTVRTVGENGRTLKFALSEFEEA